MTREKIDTLLKWLDKLGLGTNDGDGVHILQSTQGDAPAFASVILVPLCSIQCSIRSSSLEGIKQKLQEVFNRIENAGYMGNDENVKVVSELMDDIRAAVINCQVSSEAQTVSDI